jgi:hypothetical protein
MCSPTRDTRARAGALPGLADWASFADGTLGSNFMRGTFKGQLRAIHRDRENLGIDIPGHRVAS